MTSYEFEHLRRSLDWTGIRLWEWPLVLSWFAVMLFTCLIGQHDWEEIKAPAPNLKSKKCFWCGREEHQIIT